MDFVNLNRTRKIEENNETEPAILLFNYIYYFSKQNLSDKYYRCADRGNANEIGCNASINIVGNSIVKVNGK